MKTNKKIKPEDLLIGDQLDPSTLSGNAEQETNEDNQTHRIALQIYSFLKSEKPDIPDTDKLETKMRIQSSVRKLKQKRWIIRLSAAASILIVSFIAGLWYAQLPKTSEISEFAQSLSKTMAELETRLILQDGQEIAIDKKESEISYDANGQQITIGKDQKVVQKLNNLKESFNTVIVPYGRRSFITLSEGTKVWLNSGSKLIYPAVFASNYREVYIDGEAVFEVTHSEEKPFYVKTRDFNIKVLGTIFNVSAYADEKTSSTVLAQGKIELCVNDKTRKKSPHQTILPGTMAVFNPELKSFESQAVNPEDYLSWHEGYLIFRHESLANILKKITRYYNVEIDVKDTQLCEETFSGNLDLKNSPEQVLDVIAQTTPFNYENQNNKLVLTFKN